MPRQSGIVYPTPETSEKVKRVYESTSKNMYCWRLANEYLVFQAKISFLELNARLKENDFLVSASFFENIRRGRLKTIHMMQLVMVPEFWGYTLSDFLKLGEKLHRQGWEFPRRKDGGLNTQGNAGLCGSLGNKTRAEVRKGSIQRRLDRARKVKAAANT